MKIVGICIFFYAVSILAFGQQPQQPPPAGAAMPVTARPFVHGLTVTAPSQMSEREPSSPEDLKQQLRTLATSVAGRRTLIEIPSNAPQGWTREIENSSVRFLDDRGNSLPLPTGLLTTSWRNARLVRAAETDPGSQTGYTGFINMQFHYTAAKGGVNNYNGTGTKTDYFNVMVSSEMRTVGQKTGIASHLTSFSGGDTMGIESLITQFGGFDTAGDEQTEGFRLQMQQGSASKSDTGGVFVGVVSAIRDNILTYVPTHDEETLGEDRLVRDLDRAYNAGSIASITNSGGSPNTVAVTGSGTRWSQLGLTTHTSWNNLAKAGAVTQTDLTFCFDPLRGDGYDTCFPVSAIIDDTHLTLNLMGVGTAMNTSWPPAWPSAGTYHIYAAGWPTCVDVAAHTLTISGQSGLSVGHHIDQVLAYNTQNLGEQIVMNRHIGLPGRGGGINVINTGTAQAPSMGAGLAVSGAFDTTIAFQPSSQAGVPNTFAILYKDPASGYIFDSTLVRPPLQQIGLWRLRDNAGAIHTMLRFSRDSSTACVLDNSLCVTPDGAIAAKKLDQAETSDYAGVVVISGSDSATINFTRPFHSAPVCTLTPASDPSDVGPYWVEATPASVTARLRRPARISFNYICAGNPN